MVMRYGFSERLGPVVYGQNPNETFLGRDFGAGRGYSEEVAAEIDEEIREMLDEAYEAARKILSEHMDQLHVVAAALMEREKLTGDEFRTLMEGGTLPPLDAENEAPRAVAERAAEQAQAPAAKVTPVKMHPAPPQTDAPQDTQ